MFPPEVKPLVKTLQRLKHTGCTSKGFCPSDTFFFFFAHFSFSASGQAVVTGDVPSSPRFLPSIFIAHRVQQSHRSSIVHRVLLTHALALSARQLCARHVRHIRYFFHGPMHMTKSKKAKSLSRDAQPLARGPLESPRIMTS